MFIQVLDTESLKSFSLANTSCNTIANRILWRTFKISGADRHEVVAHCEAISRLPRRASNIKTLIIGPWECPGDEVALKALKKAWVEIPNLRQLYLEPRRSKVGLFGDGDHATSSPTSILRNLVAAPAHLHIRSFACSTWLRPGSTLFDFLRAHPSIRSLTGVDIFATRVPEIPHDFLPYLEALDCNRQDTAEFFTLRRRVSSLRIISAIDLAFRFDSLAKAISTSPSLSQIDIYCLDVPNTEHNIPVLLKSLAKVKVLIIRGFPFVDQSSLDINLPNLESLECTTSFVRASAEVANLAARIGPKLRRIGFGVRTSSPLFYQPTVWTREFHDW